MPKVLIPTESHLISFLEHDRTGTWGLIKREDGGRMLILSTTTVLIGRHEVLKGVRQPTLYVLSRWVFKWTYLYYLYWAFVRG